MPTEALEADSTARRFPGWVGHAAEVSTVIDGIRDRVASKIVLRGEIQGAKVFGDPPGATFELSRFDDDSGFTGLPVWIPAPAYRNVERYLSKSTSDPARVLARGSQVAVTGELALRRGTTNVQLVASRVFPWSDEPGPIESARIAAFASIHHRDPNRFADAAVGATHRHATAEQFAQSWEGNPPQNIVVLTSSASSVVADLRGVLHGANLDRGVNIEHIPIKLGWGAAAETMAALQTDLARAADLVLIVRGGGGWRDFAVFDDLPLAEAIIEAGASVPVATALGHHNDVSLADIVSMASVATPSVLATAIAKTYDVRSKQANKHALSANGRTGMTARSAANRPSTRAGSSLSGADAEMRWRARSAELRTELDETSRNLTTERQWSEWWSREHHHDLRRVAQSRIRVRSFWYAAFGWLSAAAVLLWLIASWHGEWPPHRHTWVLAACLIIAMAFSIFVSRATQRTQKPLRAGSKRNIVYTDVSSWLADARAVRSPRQYRRTLLQDSPRS